MTRHEPGFDPDDQFGRPSGRDSVEEFFAAHRAQVSDLPPDDLTWQRIRDGRRHHQSARRNGWISAAVAAAAAVALVAGPALLPDADQPDLAGAPSSQPGPVVTATGPDTGEATTGPTRTQTVTTPVPDGVIAEGAWFTDTTTADPDPQVDSGVRFGLTVRECPTGRCSQLVTTQDFGSTWRPQADLAQLGPVDQVLFTDHRRGWVWGQDASLWSTTDGGSRWSTLQTAGERVLDLSVRGNTLMAVTDGSVVITDPTDTDWSDDVVARLDAVSGARLLDTDTERYIVASDRAGRVSTMLRVQDGRPETMASLTACPDGPVAITASVNDGAHLFSLCEDQAGLAVHESSNGGRTWLPLNITVPSFVLGEQPPLMASISSDHLVLIGEGNYTMTTDGGATWSPEEFLPGASAAPAAIAINQFDDVLVYPTPQQSGPDLAFWRSRESGASWDVITPRG